MYRCYDTIRDATRGDQKVLQPGYKKLTYYIIYTVIFFIPSVLWRCWLGGRKGIRPVKNWVVRCWHGYLSGARCRLAHAQLIRLPLTVSCFSKIQIGFTFLVPAHPGSPGHRAVKWVYVCIYCHFLTYSPATSMHFFNFSSQLFMPWKQNFLFLLSDHAPTAILSDSSSINQVPRRWYYRFLIKK